MKELTFKTFSVRVKYQGQKFFMSQAHSWLKWSTIFLGRGRGDVLKIIPVVQIIINVCGFRIKVSSTPIECCNK